MTDVSDDALRALIRRAHDAMDEVSREPHRCPDDVDRFDWSADMLDQLARVALGVGQAAAALAGEDEEVVRHAEALATAIVRRRNDAITRPQARVGSPGTPDPAAVLTRLPVDHAATLRA